MSTVDDLAGVLTQLHQVAGGDLGFRAGRVTAWNPLTGANTIVVAGTALTDVPFLSSVGSFVVSVDDVVGLLKVKSQFFVLGVISVAPPNAIQQQINQLAEQFDSVFQGDLAIGGDLAVLGNVALGGTVSFTSPQMRAAKVEDVTTIDDFVNTAFAAGSPVVGLSFVAPPSRMAIITISGQLRQDVNGNRSELSFRIGTGETIGGGTETVAPSTIRMLATSQAVNDGGFSDLMASYQYLAVALTAGATYNVQAMHRTNPAGRGTLFRRQIIIQPTP